MSYRFRKIDSHSWMHAVSDKRAPTCYEVYDGDVLLGTVHSRSVESWRKTRTGIRVGFAGLSRSWEAKTPSGDVLTRYALTRQDAAVRLRRALTEAAT